MNHAYEPLADRNVRRAISYRDRPQGDHQARSCSATASRPTRSCRRRCRTTTRSRRASSTTSPRRRAELAKSTVPGRLRRRVLVGSGERPTTRSAQILQQSAASRSASPSRSRRSTRAPRSPTSRRGKYQLGSQLLDDGHRRPGRARDVRGRPERGGAHSFFTGYRNPRSSTAPQQAQRTFEPDERRASTRRSSGSPPRTRSWSSSTTRRSATRTRTRCTGFLVYPTRQLPPGGRLARRSSGGRR